MSEPLDLQSVIEDSLTDAVSEPEVEASLESSSEQTGDEVTSEAGSDDKTVIDSPSKSEQPESLDKEVASPASKAKAEEVDDEFAKAHGLPAQLLGGRENRIPYSRVKKIAANHAKAEVEKAKATWESTQAPLAAKVAELEPKVAEYTDFRTRVNQFEQIMTTQPKEFLEQVLSKIPAYKEFFEFINKAVQVMEGGSAAPQVAQASTETGMPQPDFKLEDGTMVYSMEGLQKLQDWQGQQIEARVSKGYQSQLDAKIAEINKQYAPIKQRYDQEQQLQQIVPQIQKQIEEARTWPLFNENEDAITKALQGNQNLSLEGAYRQIVIPKLQTQRDQMRTSILDEIKQKPVATAVPRAAATRPIQPGTTNQPQSLTDIIEAKVREAGLI